MAVGLLGMTGKSGLVLVVYGSCSYLPSARTCCRGSLASLCAGDLYRQRKERERNAAAVNDESVGVVVRL